MAIHDVDKHNNDRSSPVVNSHDLSPAERMAHGTVSLNPVTDATASRVTIRTKNNQVAINDGTKDIAIYGKQADGAMSLKFFDASSVGIAQFGKAADGTIALKIAQSGVEVSTATNDQLIFNSSQDVFKIVSKITISLQLVHNGTSSNGTATMAHGLSSLPGYIAFITPDSFFSNISVVNTNNGPNPFPIMVLVSGVITTAAHFIVSVDATNVTFGGVISNRVGAGTYNNTATVYLLQETAN